MDIPADPAQQPKEARQVAPVQFLDTQRYRPEIPEGTVHPSVNRSHSITVFDTDDNVAVLPADEEPTESDNDPLLIEVDPNALKGSVIEG